MTRIVRYGLRVLSALLVLLFFAVTIYDYHMSSAQMVLYYPMWGSVLFSMLIFLVPAAACLLFAAQPQKDDCHGR